MPSASRSAAITTSKGDAVPARVGKVHAYAASFGDDLARELILSSTKPGELVLDPFVGAGTTLVEARQLGRSAIGIDVDPVACLIATVLTAAYNAHELELLEATVVTKLTDIQSALLSKNLDEGSMRAGHRFSADGYKASVPDIDKIEFWFAPVQRAVLAVLVALAGSLRLKRHRAVVELAISSAIIRKWPNTLSLAMDVDHSRPHRVLRSDLTVESQLQIFRTSFLNVVKALRKMIAQDSDKPPPLKVIMGDSKLALQRLRPDSADYVLTSPPYFNAIDYPRAHQFSHWWLWPNGESLNRARYTGLRPGGKQQWAVEKSLAIAPATMPAVASLETASRATYKRLCRYVVDLDGVVQGISRVLKPRRPITLVLGNNSVRQITIPVVDIVIELLQRHEFTCVSVEERKFDPSRRRYPYGLKGFRGLMKSEYVIKARNRR